MVARKFHLKVLLIFVKMRRFADAIFALSLMRLTDISLLPPFVIVWKGLNCITCKWRDLIFAHYPFISENEQNISGSPNEGVRREREGGERQTLMISWKLYISHCAVFLLNFRFVQKQSSRPHILNVSVCKCVYKRSRLIIKPMMTETQQLYSYSCDKSKWQAWIKSGIFPGQT